MRALSLLRWVPPRRNAPHVGARWAHWKGLFELLSGRVGMRLNAWAHEVVELQNQWQMLSDEALDERLNQLRAQVRLGGLAQDHSGRLRMESMAAISIAGQREIQRLPYQVQVLAAMAMHEGCVVQMAAGEGKTLAVAVAAILHGWRGLPCHVVTSNDYLASRDVELMRPMYERCGVSVQAVVHETPQDELSQHYAADVVYATSKQLLADYLRDAIELNGGLDPARRRIQNFSKRAYSRMRGLYAAIVDEADNVLIDEAMTPLIISAPQPSPLLSQAVQAAHALAQQMVLDVDYLVLHEFRDVSFTASGKEKLEKITHDLPPVWHAPERREDLMRQALVARDVYLLDRHYLIEDGKIVILDESTGRAMPGRSWSFGLHQAIEVKEGVEISHPTKTMARMSFQEFFTHFHLMGGASGTLQGVRAELWWTYGLATLSVPTRKPSQLDVKFPKHFASRQEKWDQLVQDVMDLHQHQVPILVGTRSLIDSELIEQTLRERGLSCAVLNAKHLSQEAEIVEQAGEVGHITVATNMAGRGTDILIDASVERMGGLHVLVLEPHESSRVDWQLYGRAGRHGAPGVAQPYVSMEDDLLKRHLPRFMQSWLTVLKSSGVLRGTVLPVLLWLSQTLAQWRASAVRRSMRAREAQLRKQLSFAGEI